VRQVLLDAGDAEVAVDLVVIGLDVRVGNGPVLAVAIVGLGLEVVIGQAERQPPPDVGLASQAAGPYPGVIAAGVGVVLFVDQDVLDVIRPRPSSDVGVDVLERAAFGVRRRLDRVLVVG